MVRYLQAMIHYLSQCWSRSILPYCIPRPQWVQSPSWFRYYFNNIPQISSKNLHDHKYVNHLLSNSLRPGDAYIRHWTGSPLVQTMACHLFGTKPLSEPMLEYCYSGVPNRRAGMFIYFSFFATWPKLIWPYPFIFYGVIWQPVLSLSLTGQLKP